MFGAGAPIATMAGAALRRAQVLFKPVLDSCCTRDCIAIWLLVSLPKKLV
jgi:hypothetical protein